MQEQIEMQVKVLNQELDVSEGQKIKLHQTIQILKDQNNKVKENGKALIEKIKQRRELYRDLRDNAPAFEAYDNLMADLRDVHVDLEEKFELPPCSIATSIYKPF